MWDFSFSQALGMMVKTAPFVVLRILVYVGITLAYILFTALGAGIGYGLTSFGEGQGGGAFFGGLLGFVVVSGVLYWARAYILYLVKAGHIAVMVEYMQGETLPGGKGQIEHAQGVVKERFKEASILFAVDQVIKGVLRVLNRMVMALSRLLPIPKLNQVVGLINRIINASLTYLDEVILAYNIKTRSENPWQTSKDALILYAQNYKVMLKNAVFLVLFMYITTFLIFLLILGPIAGLAALFPGSVGFWTILAAVLLAWSLKAALLEPLAVACMMQVYFKTVEGQVPNPEWDAKLSSASAKFREMGEKAQNYVMNKAGGSAQPAASTPAPGADTGESPPPQ